MHGDDEVFAPQWLCYVASSLSERLNRDRLQLEIEGSPLFFANIV